MYISRCVIRNFRNFETLDLILKDGVTCIIGENNTGKSNLLHAIRLACDANLANYHRQLTELDFHESYIEGRPQQILIALDFTDFQGNLYESALASNWMIASDLARVTFRFRPGIQARREIENDEKQLEELSIDDYNWEWFGGGDFEPLTMKWDEDAGSGFRASDLQRFHVVLLQALRDVVSDLKTHHLSPLTKLLRVLEPPIAEKAHLLDILAQANAEIRSHTVIEELSNRIQNAYNATAGEAHELDIAVGLAQPSFASIEKALILLLGTEFFRNFDVQRNGLGLNNIMYLALLLEYFELEASTKKSPGQLLLVEEPEAHLHPQLQRVLYQSLCKKNVQTLITTHSTHITSQAPLNSFVVISNVGEAAVSCVNIAESAGLTAPQINDLERYLDATRSTLLFARKIILVEGPAELFLIPIFAKEILNIDLDSKGVSVLSIHGTHFESYALLFGPNGLRRCCAIITDGDCATDLLETEDDELPPNEVRDTSKLGSNNVKVFQSLTTLEKEIVIPGLYQPLALAADDCRAPRIAARLRKADTASQAEIQKLKTSILSLSKRIGKARFAQTLARHLSQGTAVPDYISKAILWIAD